MKISIVDDNVDYTLKRKWIVFDKNSSVKRESLICADMNMFVEFFKNQWLTLDVSLSVFFLLWLFQINTSEGICI